MAVSENIFFSGTFDEAVKVARESGKVLVVVLQDASMETFTLHSEILEHSDIKPMLAESAVVLLIDEDSEAGTSIKQAFSPASIPCVYFMINGAPVGFHEMPFDSQRFKQGFLQASNLMKEFIRTSRPQNQQSNTLSPEEVEAVKARLKEKLKQKREQEKLAAEQKEKQDELKRREDGKLMQETARRLKEQREERERELERKRKREEEEYSARLREQIRQEKLQRQLEAQNRKQQNAATAEKPTEIAVSSPPRASTSTNTCTLRIRLVSGEVINQSFPADTLLRSVYDFINQVQGNTNYVLVQNFPHRTFQPSDSNRSLKDLNLLPGANLLCSAIPVNTNSQQQNTSDGADVVSTIWGFVKKMYTAIFGILWPSTDTQPQPAENPTNTTNNNHNPSPSTAPHRPSDGPNIRDLSSLKRTSAPPNDDQAYWNGNSTQFR